MPNFFYFKAHAFVAWALGAALDEREGDDFSVERLSKRFQEVAHPITPFGLSEFL